MLLTAPAEPLLLGLMSPEMRGPAGQGGLLAAHGRAVAVAGPALGLWAAGRLNRSRRPGSCPHGLTPGLTLMLPEPAGCGQVPVHWTLPAL